MATSKTLTPTNVTISIPEMTDSPDASVFSNCVDKEADAINSLNSKVDNITIHKRTETATTNSSGTINVSTYGFHKSDIFGVFVVSPNNAFAVPEAGDTIRFYAGSNSSTTDDPIKMLISTEVTFNVLYV